MTKYLPYAIIGYFLYKQYVNPSATVASTAQSVATTAQNVIDLNTQKVAAQIATPYGVWTFSPSPATQSVQSTNQASMTPSSSQTSTTTG